jgi:hypothetical protein
MELAQGLISLPKDPHNSAPTHGDDPTGLSPAPVFSFLLVILFLFFFLFTAHISHMVKWVS